MKSLLKKKKLHKLPKEKSKYFHSFFRNSLIDDIIGCLKPFLFFTFLHSSQKCFYSPPLSLSLCSLSLSAFRFLHRFSRHGRPRCLLNWKPALAAAASPSQRNTEIHSFIVHRFILQRVAEGLEPISADIGWRQGTPWTSH